MFKKIVFLSSLFFSLLFIASFLQAGGKTENLVDPKTTISLKQYMTKFGTLMAGIEILRIKEKTIDWDSIDLTLTEMSATLNEMQTADKTGAYKAYTDLLAVQLADLKKQSERKNKRIYDSFGKLSNTCFGCHAVHRPADFLVPKSKKTASAQ